MRPSVSVAQWKRPLASSGQRFLFWSAALFVVAALAYVFLDLPVVRHFEPLQGSQFRATVSRLSRIGDSKWYLGAGAVLYVVLRWRYRILASRAAYLFASVAVTGITATALKYVVGRPRPRTFLVEGSSAFQWFDSDWRFWSMPSGHATTIAAVAMAFSIMYPRFRVPILIAGFLVAFGRVVTLDHYVSDVLAGLWLGIAGALALSKCFSIHGSDT
ncbi:MAG: phosphatase PAP2 family protein [Candidatus Hydrogenedentales bacterium]